MDKDSGTGKVQKTKKEVEETIVGKKVSLYIPEQKKSIETTVEKVRTLDSGKQVAELKSGAVLSVDILKFIEEGEGNNGKT